MINLNNFKTLAGMGKALVMAHRSELLFGASITSTLAAVGLAAKGGYEARGIVDAEQAKSPDPLTPRQKANLTWHCYMPAGIACVGAVGSTTGLHLTHIQEKKQLVAAGLMAVEEIKAEAKKIEKQGLGVVSDKEKDKIMKSRESEKGVSHVESSDGVIEEMYLVRDGKTGRDIWSNQHRIEDALIEVSNVINGSGDCELNHFYNHAGFNSTSDGLIYGWSGVLPELVWTSGKRDDGRPFREFTFRPEPRLGYDSTTR